VHVDGSRISTAQEQRFDTALVPTEPNTHHKKEHKRTCGGGLKRWESLGLAKDHSAALAPNSLATSCLPAAECPLEHAYNGRQTHHREAAKCSGVIPSKFWLLMLALEAKRLSSTVTCISRFSSCVCVCVTAIHGNMVTALIAQRSIGINHWTVSSILAQCSESAQQTHCRLSVCVLPQTCGKQMPYHA